MIWTAGARRRARGLGLAMLGILALGPTGAAPARARREAGASTFRSARATYARRKPRLEEIAVPPPAAPKTALAPVEAAAPVESGPSFPITRFEVVGDTLLGLAAIDQTLAP